MTGPRVHRAPHVDARWDDVVDLLKTAMSGEHLLCHLGHYTDGFDDVATDVLGDPAAEHEECSPEEYLETARTLSAAVSELEADLVKVRTGSLIRVVLQTGPGMAYCDSVVPDQHLIGFGRTDPLPDEVPLTQARNVRAADVLTSRLATDLRARVSRQSLNPGGWQTAHDPDDDVDPTLSPVARPGSLRQTGDLSSVLADQCRKLVDPRDLHYATWWVDGKPVFTFDVFEDVKVGRFFNEGITVAQRRRFYEGLCERLPELVTQYGRMCRRTLGGRLERLVLDVEQGAIFYYRVRPSQFLVGVTLNQNEVAPSDEKIARLAAAARTL